MHVPAYSHASPCNCSSVVLNTSPMQPSKHAAGPGWAGFGPGRADGQQLDPVWTEMHFGLGLPLPGPEATPLPADLSLNQYIGSNGGAQKSATSCASSCLKESAEFEAILNSSVPTQREESCSLSHALSLLRLSAVLSSRRRRQTSSGADGAQLPPQLCHLLPAGGLAHLGLNNLFRPSDFMAKYFYPPPPKKK